MQSNYRLCEMKVCSKMEVDVNNTFILLVT
jgi:hypothetical protein